ncbi:MAG: hypothetical protein ACI4JY_04205 [Oscillospiraceae bacterium]
MYSTDDEAKALRFDYLLYMPEFRLICGDKYSRGRTDLMKKATALAEIGNIPAITAQKPLIEQLLHTDYDGIPLLNDLSAAFY